MTILLLTTCNSPEKAKDQNTLFQLLSAEETGIHFENTLSYQKDFNIFTYRNFYNGGGVAIGDINNDGLPDIYFIANMASNKLYLNQGDFKFKDITVPAGVGGKRAWSTGVTMVDINGDGWLDIYVCNSGNMPNDDRRNELFINNQNGTFTESASTYHLDDEGYSSQATFFDYDRDGDLDVYLINNSFISTGSAEIKSNSRQSRDQLGGDKLFRNDNGIFTDVSLQANIYGSVIGFGLGAITSDLNQDGWLDIYVCNDFFERDYIYMNNGDGTFNEELPLQLQSINQASMGVDAADINGDGYPEIFVTEMLPKSDDRFKTTMIYEDWESYVSNLENDYYHQFTRNTLQLNNQEITPGYISFSEIGRLSGVEATDWSWSGLFIDLDNNGHKDIYITNGIYQDILDKNFLKKISNNLLFKDLISNKEVDFKKLIDAIPSTPIANFAYAGGEQYLFADSTLNWGLAQPGFSNGASYADLDNDGDLDLVVNNLNMPPFIYRNKTIENYPSHHFLKIKLIGKDKNSNAVGAKVKAYADEKLFQVEQIPTRGFQSSVDNSIVIGLGNIMSIDSLIVEWPTGNKTTMKDVAANGFIEIDEKSSTERFEKKSASNSRLFTPYEKISLQIKHQESQYNDFTNASLIFQMSSTEGPGLAVGDINSDGREDFFLCGAKGYPGQLLIQDTNGGFVPTSQQVFELDKYFEDMKAVFFDADGDQDLDLFVTSGSPEYLPYSAKLFDRLYLNDGKGTFQKSTFQSPAFAPENSSCVRATDFDKDGDMDLFIGTRSESNHYGKPQNGYILQNDGTGYFTNVTNKIAPGLENLGMIRDARWLDFNNDDQEDLVVTGEWMSISLFQNSGGTFKDVTEGAGLTPYSGWWNCLEVADVDNDGDMDIIAGNHGLNSRFKATFKNPITMHVNDFDNNNVTEHIISTYDGKNHLPYAQYGDLQKQIPSLKNKFDHHDEKSITLEDLFNEDQINSSIILQTTYLESAVFLNNGQGQFTVHPLPMEAQFSPIYSILANDINGDGNLDLLVGGNLYEVKPEVGRYDASYGLFLEGKGDGSFTAIPNSLSGLNIVGQIRDIKSISMDGHTIYLFSLNDDVVHAYKFDR